MFKSHVIGGVAVSLLLAACATTPGHAPEGKTVRFLDKKDSTSAVFVSKEKAPPDFVGTSAVKRPPWGSLNPNLH